MKNTFGKIFCALLMVILCLSMVSCNIKLPFEEESSLVFDKKYIAVGTLEEERQTYFIFYSDHTGKFEDYMKYESSYGSEYGSTVSGTIEFEWREADDGSIYLFKTNVILHDDHDYDSDPSLPDYPMTVGDEFIAYTTTGDYGRTGEYVLEGSELAKSLKD